MSTPVIAFFNNKGGVGKTSLVYHLAWMYSDLGTRVLAADLDPQANLTAAFLDEDRLEVLWREDDRPATIYGAIRPLVTGTGDFAGPHVEIPDDSRRELGLVCGDLLLSGFEDELADGWSKCLDAKPRAFRVISAFWRLLQRGAESHAADAVLVDLGPNLGAINRAALIGADFVVIPLSPDLFSLQGLRNLGPTLRRWREEWAERRAKNPDPAIELPRGTVRPIGYIVLQHSVRLDRPVRAYDKWIARIPEVYRTELLAEEPAPEISIANDPNAIFLLKHYRSLMPMAQEARKPMFHLRPADGAIGSHFTAAQAAYADFKTIALHIAERAGLQGVVAGSIDDATFRA